MKRNSLTSNIVYTLILAAIAAGIYYLNQIKDQIEFPTTTPEQKQTTWETLTPRQNQPATQAKTMPNVSAETSSGRTDTPIKCHDPEIGEFWTNATTCEAADLNNRISYAQSPETAATEAEKKYSGKDYMPPDEEAMKSRMDQKGGVKGED